VAGTCFPASIGHNCKHVEQKKKEQKARECKCYQILTKPYFSGEIFQNSGRIYSSGGADPSMACGTVFQVSVDSSHWKL